MSRRPLTPKQRAWLQDEMPVWQSGGLVSAEQTAGILGLYESAQESSDRRGAKLVFTLMSLAGLLVAMAVLLLVAINWDALPSGLKLAALVGALSAAHATGYWMRYRCQPGALAEIPFFLGCLLFGVTLWQIALIFHIETRYPTGIWIWALSVLPFALCADTLLLHALYAALLAFWVGAEVLDYGRFGCWLLGIYRFDILPNAAYSLPLWALPGLLWAYRKRSSHGVALYALLLAWWIVLQPVAWGHSAVVIFAIGAVGALLLLVSQAHRPLSPLAIPYRFYGTLIAAGALIPLSFASFQYELLYAVPSASGLPMAAILAGAGLITAALVVGVRRLVDPEWAGRREEIGAGLRRMGIPGLMLLAMIGLSLWSWAFAAPGQRYLNYMQRSDELLFLPPVLVPTLLCNLVLLAFCVWLMRMGLTEDRGRPFAGGVALFLVWAVLRYIDLFGEIGGVLGGALMFLLCGAGLYGVARFWQAHLPKVVEASHV